MSIARITGLKSQPVARGGNVRQQNSGKATELATKRKVPVAEIARQLSEIAMEENVTVAKLDFDVNSKELGVPVLLNSKRVGFITFTK